MLWPREQFHVAYQQVLSDAIGTHGSSVLLLVAPDVDSIAAVSILTSLLQADMVAYSLVPIAGYKQMADMTFSSEIRSIFLINCGAMIDVYTTLKLTDQKVYVLDSHRPIHLANVHDRHGIVAMFDDEGQAEDDFPEEGSDIEAIEQEEEGDEDEDDDDDESDDEAESDGEAEFDQAVAAIETDEAAPVVGEKRKRTDSEEDGDGDDDDAGEEGHGDGADDVDADAAEGNDAGDEADDDDDGDDDKASADEDKAADGDDEPEEETVPAVDDKQTTISSKRKRRLDILQYYRGTFHGAPAATLAFELATQLNQGSQDKVWYAIVGLTKQFLAQQIDADNYNMLVQKFQDEVLSLATGTDEVKDVDGTVLPSMQDGTIAFEEEYRFILYRHWSLYDSMYYSNYVAAKLKSWQAAGKDELEVLLARMGLSLKECQQSFTFMSRELKQNLRDKFHEIAPDFGLDDVFYGSFRRHFEFKHQWCAADVVYGLSALLEAPAHVTKKAVDAYVPDAIAGADDDDADDSAPFWQSSFHLAMQALPCKSSRSCLLLERGMHVAMQLQRAIVHLATSILDRKLIVRVKHFRYVCLRLTEDEELLFSHASTLSKLALFLVDLHREQGKWSGKQAAPFVLISHLKARNVYLVVGVTCPDRAGEIHRKYVVVGEFVVYLLTLA
ncbi:Aste57867_10654 [Aphanomyces stellatus]|uniref:Aste57867_10654 protein n=1 Tax=Aphanomyces stellatus TaxID=120398 RepID=A0A485KRM4_9STRA|nr:hypothetical protein As57867_010614 [Aphanomyces stellatus]VFT87526.1 Aste57867_10654 [Aphanomyces stellatus]